MSVENREFDLIVFGASGFTGQFVVEEVARSAQKEAIRWAVSGRSANKLKEVLNTATKETGIDVTGVTTIEADITDEESIKAMTGRTKLVLNCVGPYRFYGEQVVKACVETATNHLDIAGEPQYIEAMQVKYDKAAKEKGIYIISACGYDSIPCDLGVQFLKRQFDGEVNAVETFMTVRTGKKGMTMNYATYLSAVHGFATSNELKDIRRRLYKEIYTKKRSPTKFKLERRNLPFTSPHVSGWCLPFPGSDRSVVQRTQQFNYETQNEKPTQIETYFTVKSNLYMIATLFIGTIFGIIASFKWGRDLLEAHPKFFSLGLFSKEGPTRAELRDTSFTLTVVGRGWTERLTDEPTHPPNKTVVVVVSGKDPGYTATATCLVQSGISLLKDSAKMPNNGGVLTPGAAFAKTGIYDRFRAHELYFDLMTDK